MFTELSTALSGASATQVCAALAYLKQADICFMNCEMPLTRRGYQIEKTVNLRSDPGVAQDLATLGIHVVSLANNHMMDYGYEGLDDTLAFIDRAGIARVGAGMNIEEALRPHYRTMKGQRFAFISVATTLPPGFAASSGRPGIASIHVAFSFDIDTNLMAEQPGTAPVVRTVASPQDVDRVTAVIAAARCEADHVIVSVHWGITRRRVIPCQGMIAEYQRPLGRAFIDAGADIVLGNRSHNLHGIEVHRGKPIFYSLGNFIFQRPHDYMEPESTLVLADFVGPSLQIRLVPVLLNPSGFPEMPNAAERNRIIAVLKERSAPFGTEVTVDGQSVVINLGGKTGSGSASIGINRIPLQNVQ